ncbi:hypothetical protein V6N13_105409 [Hibiscus sabdariffa]
MVELDIGSASLGTGDVVAGGLGLSHFPAIQHPLNVGKEVQGPCAVGSGSATVVKEWNLFDQSLNFFPPEERDGKILVQPPREVLVNGAKQWSNALIANFLGKSPPLYVFQRTADKLWGREGSVVIRFLAPGVYIVKFPSQKVCDWVLESDPWHIQQKAIVLRRWTPGLIPEVLSLDTAAVWLRLWHVPLELYSQQGLSYLASALGKPLYTDRATTLRQNLEFAKICVDIAASFTLPTSVLVDLGDGNIVDIQVELFWAPPKCAYCSIFGHLEEKYSRKDVVQTNVGTKNEDVLNSSYGTHDVDIGDGGGSVIYEDNVVQANVVQPVNQGIKLVEIEDGINHVGAVGSSAAVSNSVVSIKSIVCSNKFEALINTVVEHEAVVLSPRKVAGGVAELLNQLKPKPKGPGHKKGKFNKEVFGEISKKVQAKQIELSNVQKLVLATLSADLIASEKKVAGELIELSKTEEKKLKVHHKANTIHSLQDRNGVRLDTFEAISGKFIQFFSESLGAMDSNVEVLPDDLLREILDTELSTEMQNHLVAPVTQKEIKDVLFSMNGNKASGPDGFFGQVFPGNLVAAC